MDLYIEAAAILRRANQKEGLLKNLVYSSTYKNLKQMFALVSEIVKYQSILKEILSKCGPGLLDEELINGDKLVAVVLLYEFLLGNKFGHSVFIRKCILKYKSEIRLARDNILERLGCRSLHHIKKEKSDHFSKVPRYARVNLVKCNMESAIEQLQGEGWIYNGKLKAESFQRDVEAMEEHTFCSDSLLDDLLVFAPGTDLHNHSLVMSGVLVLQDKASCIPARVLNPKPGSVVLDCCAAPGNKTCHLASLMGDKGRVIALDRDEKRVQTMSKLLERSGLTCIELIHQDFLTLSPDNEDAAKVEMILIDPSCSGSGMPGSLEDKVDPERLRSLKRFQISILKHALKFPNAQWVSYSTCSVHQQENEEVVEEVMALVKSYYQFKPVFPELTECRGLKEFPNYEDFLRLTPEKDLTRGFFVACFERIKAPKKKTKRGRVKKRSNETLEDADYSDADHDEEETKTSREGENKETDSVENEDEYVPKGKRRKASEESPNESTPLSAAYVKEGDDVNDNASDMEGDDSSNDEEKKQRIKKEKKKRKKEKKRKETSLDCESEELVESECLIHDQSQEMGDSETQSKRLQCEEDLGDGIDEVGKDVEEKSRKKSKKEKKHKIREDVDLEINNQPDSEILQSSETEHSDIQKGKRKSRKDKHGDESISLSPEAETLNDSMNSLKDSDQKKRKKSKKDKNRELNEENEDTNLSETSILNDSTSTVKQDKKREKSKKNKGDLIEESKVVQHSDDEKRKKKSKKDKYRENEETYQSQPEKETFKENMLETGDHDEEETKEKRKKKKKRKSEDRDEDILSGKESVGNDCNKTHDSNSTHKKRKTER